MSGMKRFVLAFLLLSLPFMAYTQIIKERRVYYLDCSFSMELNKDVVSGKPLWDLVRDNLKKAIDNVSDETTELVVIPFAFDSQPNPTLSPISAKATAAGKEMIKSKIDGLPMNKKTMTYHYVPIEDFYNNQVADDRITYMFLMTDGQDEDPRQRAKNLLKEWGSKFGNKNVFGFYVMLCNNAKSSKIEEIVEQQDHLWKVETADININLVRLKDNKVFNKRIDRELLTIEVEQGSLSNCPIEILETICDGDYYMIDDKLRVEENRIICKILPKNDSLILPEETMMTLRFKPVSPSKANSFTCLVNDKISIKCKDKKEKTLKIRFE